VTTYRWLLHLMADNQDDESQPKSDVDDVAAANPPKETSSKTDSAGPAGFTSDLASVTVPTSTGARSLIDTRQSKVSEVVSRSVSNPSLGRIESPSTAVAGENVAERTSATSIDRKVSDAKVRCRSAERRANNVVVRETSRRSLQRDGRQDSLEIVRRDDVYAARTNASPRPSFADVYQTTDDASASLFSERRLPSVSTTTSDAKNSVSDTFPSASVDSLASSADSSLLQKSADAVDETLRFGMTTTLNPAAGREISQRVQKAPQSKIDDNIGRGGEQAPTMAEINDLDLDYDDDDDDDDDDTSHASSLMSQLRRLSTVIEKRPPPSAPPPSVQSSKQSQSEKRTKKSLSSDEHSKQSPQEAPPSEVRPKSGKRSERFVGLRNNQSRFPQGAATRPKAKTYARPTISVTAKQAGPVFTWNRPDDDGETNAAASDKRSGPQQVQVEYTTGGYEGAAESTVVRNRQSSDSQVKATPKSTGRRQQPGRATKWSRSTSRSPLRNAPSADDAQLCGQTDTACVYGPGYEHDLSDLAARLQDPSRGGVFPAESPRRGGRGLGSGRQRQEYESGNSGQQSVEDVYVEAMTLDTEGRVTGQSSIEWRQELARIIDSLRHQMRSSEIPSSGASKPKLDLVTNDDQEEVKFFPRYTRARQKSKRKR